MLSLIFVEAAVGVAAAAAAVVFVAVAGGFLLAFASHHSAELTFRPQHSSFLSAPPALNKFPPHPLSALAH